MEKSLACVLVAAIFFAASATARKTSQSDSDLLDLNGLDFQITDAVNKSIGDLIPEVIFVCMMNEPNHY